MPCDPDWADNLSRFVMVYVCTALLGLHIPLVWGVGLYWVLEGDVEKATRCGVAAIVITVATAANFYLQRWIHSHV